VAVATDPAGLDIGLGGHIRRPRKIARCRDGRGSRDELARARVAGADPPTRRRFPDACRASKLKRAVSGPDLAASVVLKRAIDIRPDFGTAAVVPILISPTTLVGDYGIREGSHVVLARASLRVTDVSPVLTLSVAALFFAGLLRVFMLARCGLTSGSEDGAR
jgi:hypothetical protein